MILADGFYEWRRQEKEKQPFFIYFPQSQGGSEAMTPCTLKEESPMTPCTPKEEFCPEVKEVSDIVCICSTGLACSALQGKETIQRTQH